MSDFDVGARVRYLGLRGREGSAGVTVTILRANDDGTFDVAPVDEVGTVVESVPAQQLRKAVNRRRDSSGVLSNESFDSDSDDGGGGDRGAGARAGAAGPDADPDDGEQEAAARRIQAAHRARAAKAKASEQAEEEAAAARRIQAAHRARSPRGRTGVRFADEDAKADLDNARVNGMMLSDDEDDDGDAEDDDDETIGLASAPPPTKLDLRPLDPSSADFSSLQDTLDHLTDRVNDLTALANAHAEQLVQKDATIKSLYKKLKKSKNDAKKAMAKSYKHHAKTFAKMSQQLRDLQSQVVELQQEKDANIAIRDDLLKRVADNTRHIQENWKTIKHYRAQLDEKADAVDVLSKVEKADVIAFIEERQSSWEEVQNDTIMVNVKQEFSQVQNNFQQLVDKQHSQLEESVAQTRSFLGDKLAALEAQLEKTTEATDTLGAIGAELQGGHVSQERQLADIRKAIDATKRRIFESNIGGLHDDVGKLQRRVQTVSVDLSGESEAVKSRVAELEEQLTARQAQIETLHSQLATLTEKQEEQATVQQQMREQAEALQKEREEEAERLRQQQELEEQQRSRRRGGGRGRGRKTSKLGSTSATTGPRGETKNNGRPHTSNGRLAGGAMSAGGERNRTHSPQRPQTAANQMDNMVIGTKVNPTAARNNNNNNNANDGDGDDGEWGEDGYDNESADTLDRVSSLEQRMAQAVEVLAHSMTRMERNILTLADSDPLRRSGFKLSQTHDARLTNMMEAYNTSSAFMARQRPQTVIKIGDRGDSLRFERRDGGDSPAGSFRPKASTSLGTSSGGPRTGPRRPGSSGGGGGSGSGGARYRTGNSDHLVDIHSGRKNDGTWAFSPAQITYRQKETREIAQRAREDSPMRHQLGRDGRKIVMQEDSF